MRPHTSHKTASVFSFVPITPEDGSRDTVTLSIAVLACIVVWNENTTTYVLYHALRVRDLQSREDEMASHENMRNSIPQNPYLFTAANANFCATDGVWEEDHRCVKFCWDRISGAARINFSPYGNGWISVDDLIKCLSASCRQWKCVLGVWILPNHAAKR